MIIDIIPILAGLFPSILCVHRPEDSGSEGRLQSHTSLETGYGWGPCTRM
jgi:hypothetical protein